MSNDIVLAGQNGHALARREEISGADLMAEMLGEFEGLALYPTVWAFDGKDGVYRDTETKDDKSQGIPRLTGRIGGSWPSQCFFPPRKPEETPPAERKIWGVKDDPQRPKFICSRGKLNPNLTEAQKELAVKLGAGSGCDGCKLREWGQDDEKPRCTEFINISFARQIDEAGEEHQFGVVRAKTFSIKILKKHMALPLKMGKPPAYKLTELTGEIKGEGDESFCVAKAAYVGPEADRRTQMEWLKQFKEMNPRLRQVADEAQHHDEPAPAPDVAGGFDGFASPVEPDGFEQGVLDVPF